MRLPPVIGRRDLVSGNLREGTTVREGRRAPEVEGRHDVDEYDGAGTPIEDGESDRGREARKARFVDYRRKTRPTRLVRAGSMGEIQCRGRCDSVDGKARFVGR